MDLKAKTIFLAESEGIDEALKYLKTFKTKNYQALSIL